MGRINRWRLFAGLIVLFAGLNLTLLLSHLSRFVGLGLILIGLLILISARETWREKFRRRSPDIFRELFFYPTLPYLQTTIFILVILLSIIFLSTSPGFLMVVLFVAGLSESILWFVDKHIEEKRKVLAVIQFHLFLFFSTFVSIHIGDMTGYEEAPESFTLILLFVLWLLEIIYLYRYFALGRGKHPKREETYSKEEKDKEEGEEGAEEEETEEETESQESNEEKEKATTLSESFIHYITLKSRLKPYFFYLGLLAILGTVAFNLIVGNGLDLGSHDGIAILFGLSLLTYHRVPKTYSVERDFVFIFLFFMVLILVVPVTLIYYFYGGLPENSNSPVIYHLLAQPTAGLLNVFNIDATAYRTGASVIIKEMSLKGEQLLVHIGLSCTGLYSVTTFISAFLGFVMVYFTEMTRDLSVFLFLGIFLSWVANVLRMTLIMVSGYYYGMEALLWTHHNAGVFIFMGWIALFWGLMFKYFDIPVDEPMEEAAA